VPADVIAAPATAAAHPPAISVENLRKVYASGFVALNGVTLRIQPGEIFALLGPNGAGKTTLIGILCGLVTPTSGLAQVAGHDIVREPRAARACIGLVPQELLSIGYETVWATVQFSRSLFGKPPNPHYVEQILRSLSLWDRKDAKVLTLSGGMKRRVMIAKALSHEPQVLFLDEPTAGVDVELRREMWALVRSLRDRGVTIILTTHYIEEAEEMADRVGVINRGELMLTESKNALMRKFAAKQLTLQLLEPLAQVPQGLAPFALRLSSDGRELAFTYDGKQQHHGVADLLAELSRAGISFRDLNTSQNSLEQIFVNLLRGPK
jgi:ABC-2 type transport system ATP-binding protein